MEATLETPKPQEQPQLEGQEMAEAPTDDVMAESPEVTNS